MYLIYSKEKQEGSTTHYKCQKQVHFFGCKSGLIPKLMRQAIPEGQSEPADWHIDVGEELGRFGQPNSCLVINLKPNNKNGNVSLYEVNEVWGCSRSGWTPIMMRLDELVTDAKPSEVNANDFEVLSSGRSPIYTFLYLAGSLVDGELVGKWTAPRASPTNSVLLWPYALKYFLSGIGDSSPEIVEHRHTSK